MQFFFVALLAFLLAPSQAWAMVDEEGYDEHTIRRVEVSLDAPRFETYKSPSYNGKNAKVRIVGTALLFQTRINALSKARPNFAGRFVLGTWGCDTNCTQIVVINAVTGTVYEPKGLTANDATNVHEELLSSDFLHEAGPVKFSNTSRLLVVIGAPEEDTKRRGISYYVWSGTKFVLIRFVKKE